LNRQLTVWPDAVVATRPNGLQELPTTGTAVLVGRGGIGGIGPRDRDALVVALADGLGDALVFGVDGRGRAATGGTGAGAATVSTAIADGIRASGRTAGAGPPMADESVDEPTSPEFTDRSPADSAGWGPDGRAMTITIKTAIATATAPAIGMPMDANDRARLCRPMIPLRPRAYCREGSLPARRHAREARPKKKAPIRKATVRMNNQKAPLMMTPRTPVAMARITSNTTNNIRCSLIGS
jgi:hypothetical protein